MPSGHRPDIQGLRAIAVTLVVLGHLDVPGFAGGFVGVDVFFVLSGFLITGLLLREYEATGRIHYLRFLARRLRRLLPALLVMLAAVSLLGMLLLSEYELRIQSGSFVYAATWTSNLYFALSEFDYFSPLQARDLYLHTWSLGVEEQFYLAWPLLIYAGYRALSRHGRAPRSDARFIVILAAVAAASLALPLFWAKTQALLAFYSMPTRAWQFALGAILALAARRAPAANPDTRLGGIVAAAGVVSILASALFLHRQLSYPGIYALLPSAGAALVIAAGQQRNAVHELLTNRVLVWLGDRSYSVYLWHWPSIVLLAGAGLGAGVFRGTAVCALTIAVAAFSYRWIELPFWKGDLGRVRPARAILVSTLGVTVLVGGVVQAHRLHYGADVARGFSIAYDARADRPSFYAQGCDTWFASAEVIPCSEPEGETGATAVLIGDSIGVQWHAALAEIFAPPAWRLVTFTKSNCAIVDVDFYYERIKRTFTECAEWRDGVIDYLAGVEPDLVIIGSSRNYGFSEDQWVDGTGRVLERLTGVAANVVIIPGTPSLPFDGPGCLEESVGADTCSRRLQTPAPDDVARLLAEAAARYDNAATIDLSDIVCPGRECSAISDDGIIVFRDTQHITDRFARSRADAVRERLVAAGTF
jgi:peptidoglycan/LPS O-acetylase OafA/YrhL